MRIVYWARLQLARQQVIEGIQSVPGVELQVTTTFAETLAALPGATGLVLVHGPQEEAKQVFALLRSKENTVKWLHFISAGREGYEELGWPPGVTVSYAGGGVSPAVAEHAMALILAMGRRVPDMVTTIATRTPNGLARFASSRPMCPYPTITIVAPSSERAFGAISVRSKALRATRPAAGTRGVRWVKG